MRDMDVRKATHDRLFLMHAQDPAQTLFVDELGLCGQVRVDIAVVNGVLSGYELKSESDNLKRLPTQVEVYSKVLDEAVLVVAEKHADHAMKLLPQWWGVICATWDGCSVGLVDQRPAQANPGIDPLSLAQLLWRDEVLAELELRGLARGFRSKPRNVLWQRLVDNVELDELRRVVRHRLKTREGWRSVR